MGDSDLDARIGGGTATTIEEVSRIDVRYLRKHVLLVPGCCGRLWWFRSDKPIGSISFSVFDNHLQLDYRVRGRGEGAWRPVVQTVWLDRMQCNFSGERLWFLCPRCGRPVALICLHPQMLLLPTLLLAAVC